MPESAGVTVTAHRHPVEIDPAEPIGEAMERAISATGETELRIGSHLYVVHRRDVDPSNEEPKGNVHQVLAAARAFREEVGDDFDFDAMRARIEAIREYDRQRPIAKLD